MNKIIIRYSHDNDYPWRIFDVTNSIVYNSKELKMIGIFKGVSPFESFVGIETLGYYERSSICSIKKSIDRNFLSSEIMQIDEITVYGQYTD